MADQQLYSGGAAMCVSSLERAAAREWTSVGAHAYRLYIYYIIYIYTHVHTYTHICTHDVYLCVRGIQCTKQCTKRCIYTREIIAIGGALVFSRYIDLRRRYCQRAKTSSLAERPKRTPASETSSVRCVRACVRVRQLYASVTPLPIRIAFEGDAFTP